MANKLREGLVTPEIAVLHCATDSARASDLLRHLRLLGDVRGFSVWDETMIPAGADRSAEIQHVLDGAQVVVPLISVDFLHSSLFESLRALWLEQGTRPRGRVAPVVLRPCSWHEIDWLNERQVLPDRERPLSAVAATELEQTLKSVAESIAALVKVPRRRWVPLPTDALPLSTATLPMPNRLLRDYWRPGLIACSLALVVGVSVWRPLSPRQAAPQAVPPTSPSTSPPTVALRPVMFETVTLDERGRPHARRMLEAPSFLQELEDGIAIELVLIPAGSFDMGSPANEPNRDDDEGPQRRVFVAPFYLGRLEVTQEQWRVVTSWPAIDRDLPASPSHFKGLARPVENVSWYEATEFCNRLKKRSGRAYRLPSEAEWEYAARAHTQTPFTFGETLTSQIANYNASVAYRRAPRGRFRQATTVGGSFAFANAFGLHDIHGNVWEWTADPWHDSYVGAPSDARPWHTRGNDGLRVLRGGAWRTEPRHCRVAARGYARPAERNAYMGFRVACPAGPEAID